MDSENSQIQSDLDETLAINDKRIMTSTRIEDNNDQSVIEIKKEIPVIEILEETTTSFVAEADGVIHVKTETLSKTVTEISAKGPENGTDGAPSEKKEDPVDNGDASKDGKKEDKVSGKNDPSVADIYLQLDVTDNLDTYVEREKARKLHLSEAAAKNDENATPKKATIDNDKTLIESEKDTDTSSINETVIEIKKESDCDTVENPEPTAESIDKNDAATVDNQSPKTAESKQDVAGKPLVKSETGDADKKDNNRFIWVSNVEKTTKATNLKMHLAAFGKVQLAKIVTDGKAFFGYIVMESREDVLNCIQNLQNSIFEGKPITLSDKSPQKKKPDNVDEASKDKNVEKPVEREAKQKSKSRDPKPFRPEYGDSPSSDPLTLKVADSKQRGYSEEKRRIDALEQKRLLRERISAERRDIEQRRRELEMDRKREKEREIFRKREKERRRREQMEIERQRHVEMKLEKERKRLEYERKMIEKEKLELLRYKRKLLSKQKESEERKRAKYTRIEDHGTKSSSMNMTKEFWKSEGMKSPSSHEMFKKSNQEICVTPPPPVLSVNYHSVSERSRSPDRERPWYERKEYDSHVKSFARKIDGYNVPGNGRQSHQSYTKEQYKPKEHTMQQPHSWGEGFSSYKEQSIPVLRSESPRVIHQVRQQNYQGGSYGAPPQDYYSSSNYRKTNDYYTRPSDRKY